jgi:hypothetical protein
MFFDRSLYVQSPKTSIQIPCKSKEKNEILTYPSFQSRNGQRAYHTLITTTTTTTTNTPQILFLIGLTLIIGVQKTIAFFSRPAKLKGTAAFTVGIVLILLRWPLTGFLIELYGLFILFGDFLVTIGQFAGNIPVIGPYIQRGLEVLAGGRSNQELPV